MPGLPVLTFPPSGLDWADGLNGNPGTATPANAIDISPYAAKTSYFEESADSPDIERGEQATIRHVFTLDWTNATVLIQALGRGTFMIDSFQNITRVLTCDLQREKGGKGRITITAESISFDTPPDEFEVEDVELNPAVEKNPIFQPITGDGILSYGYNLDRDGNKIDNDKLSGFQIIQIAKNSAAAATTVDQTSQISQFNVGSMPNTTDLKGNPVDMVQLATQLYNLYLKQEDTFYMAGWKVIWSQYYWYPPSTEALDGGGYIQDPVLFGGLPAYFWSDTGDNQGHNLLGYYAELSNPDIYRNGISWLRTADKVTFQRTWFKVTRTWLGGPLGTWDPFIYPIYIQ